MKVKLDENMPADLADLLRSASHDVDTVQDEGLSGSSDPEILRAATSENRIVITFDVGFGNIREYRPGTHAGVIVFRLREQRWESMELPADGLSNRIFSLISKGAWPSWTRSGSASGELESGSGLARPGLAFLNFEPLNSEPLEL